MLLLLLLLLLDCRAAQATRPSRCSFAASTACSESTAYFTESRICSLCAQHSTQHSTILCTSCEAEALLQLIHSTPQRSIQAMHEDYLICPSPIAYASLVTTAEQQLLRLPFCSIVDVSRSIRGGNSA